MLRAAVAKSAARGTKNCTRAEIREPNRRLALRETQVFQRA
jgi:hypothetical protein